ncbi:MAG: 16S rRNA (uracil(1498)-N(3))-methyltransferase [Propionibacteriaceae bacterium]|jgi:16S rRNA (uracil1498-N3)-methyltransferase|nr:16S rRNA (uracil(1498)-N(3))-methyltransferase [Propionibacteriaceae bacterium]
MTASLFFAEQVPNVVGAIAYITGTEAHHGVTVRRLRLGEQVYVADGAGSAVLGAVVAISKTQVAVSAAQVFSQVARSPHRWVAVQALPKGERAELAIEMLSELGVSEIVAWQAARSVSRWSEKIEKGVAKWRSTAREAAKQSRRFQVPQVSYATTAQLVERIQSASIALICHQDATAWVESVTLPATGDVVFIVGPEGGISENELTAFQAAGAVPVRIATHVLRTSTAGAVMLSELQSLLRRSANV